MLKPDVFSLTSKLLALGSFLLHFRLLARGSFLMTFKLLAWVLFYGPSSIQLKGVSYLSHNAVDAPELGLEVFPLRSRILFVTTFKLLAQGSFVVL